METIEREQVVTILLEDGAAQDRAVMYADVFCEYLLASRNIEKNGLIVGHPRTGNPIENPYLAVRDRALRKVSSMRDVKAARLWEEIA